MSGFQNSPRLPIAATTAATKRGSAPLPCAADLARYFAPQAEGPQPGNNSSSEGALLRNKGSAFVLRAVSSAGEHGFDTAGVRVFNSPTAHHFTQVSPNGEGLG